MHPFASPKLREAWRGAVARQLRARRRQAEALELFHGATRREALRQLSARQLCRARPAACGGREAAWRASERSGESGTSAKGLAG